MVVVVVGGDMPVPQTQCQRAKLQGTGVIVILLWIWRTSVHPTERERTLSKYQGRNDMYSLW